MTRIAIDTGCLVATLCAWHDRHGEVLASMTAAVERGDVLLVAAHSLAEVYSVLTRLPAPLRVYQTAALDLLGRNLARFQIVALRAGEYWLALSDSASRGISGGTVYDALIAAAARAGGADVLWTLNERHMVLATGDLLPVEAPGTAS